MRSSNQRSKKVLVTGSNGFIGGYLVEALLLNGYHVIGLDNFSKYGKVEKSFDSHPSFELIRGDAAEPDIVYDALDGCSHLIAGAAMIGGISYFHSYAFDLLETNNRIIGSTTNAAIRRFGEGLLEKVTYISSSMVFESTTRWPSSEGDELKIPPPLSSYGFQKLAVEYYAKAAFLQHQLPYTIVRPFNCVGIGESRALGDVEIDSGNVKLAMSHVVPDLVQKILRGQNPLHILGDGDQIRHYTYGGDLAKGIVLTLENPSAINTDFNLSTSRGHTVKDLAAQIWQLIHGNLDDFCLVSDEPFEYDVKKRIPNVEKAERLLGFRADTELKDMLSEVIPWIAEAIRKGTI
jgi:nucleoside-diphosphate-sugar epimerase